MAITIHNVVATYRASLTRAIDLDEFNSLDSATQLTIACEELNFDPTSHVTKDRKLTHRTRHNTAAIVGLTHALDQHTSAIRIAIRTGRETDLQAALADLMQDALALESAVVEQEQ